jgi:hypothetical protein
MTARTIWYLIKLFTAERYANQFMAGELYLNTLSYFKEAEEECTDDGRLDPTEAVAMWLQPDDIFMKLTAPGIRETEITSKDLAAPISASFDYHNHVNIFCLYALKTTGFDFIDRKVRFRLSSSESTAAGGCPRIFSSRSPRWPSRLFLSLCRWPERWPEPVWLSGR